MRSVDSLAEARAAVDDLHRAGVDFIKVGDTVPPDAYPTLVDRARGHGLPVAGHLPVGVGAADAALAGQRSIEHFGSARFHKLLLLASSSEQDTLARRVQAPPKTTKLYSELHSLIDLKAMQADRAGRRLTGPGVERRGRPCDDQAAIAAFSSNVVNLLREGGSSPAQDLQVESARCRREDAGRPDG